MHIFTPQAILSDIPEQTQLKDEVIKLATKRGYQVARKLHGKLQSMTFQIRVPSATLLYSNLSRQKNFFYISVADTTYLQLINKIGWLSLDLKNLYKTAFEVEELKAVEVAYKEYHSFEISSDSPTHSC